MRHTPLRRCNFRNTHLCPGESRMRLFYQAVLDLDTVKLFQHWFGGDEDEDHRCGGVDQIHGKAGYIVGLQHFPIERLGIVHQRSGGVHDAAIDDNCRKRAEGSKASATAAQETFAEQHTCQEADNAHAEHLPGHPRALGEQHI